MRATRVFTVLAAVAVIGVACGDDPVGIPAGLEVFTATLNGANERPTPATTPATGEAIITVLGNLVSWKITAGSIENINIGHIHYGLPDSAGGVMVDLAPTAGDYPTSATIALGSLMVADSVLTHMRNGRAYVNIHTTDGVADAVGPAGDYPGGEIRGQLRKQ